MSHARLLFPLPSTDASLGFNALLTEHARIAGELRAIDAAQRAATEAVQHTSAALADLERRRAGGQAVTDAERRKLEKALADARARANEPWQERAAGLRAATRDADAAVTRYAVEHFEALAAEVAEDANEAKGRMDAALEEVVAASQARQQVDTRAAALLRFVQTPRPGDVPASTVDEVVRAASTALLAGGERAPIPRRREIANAVESVSA